MRKELCSLSRKTAIEIVKEQDHVYWKSGVWNKYSLRTDIDKVIRDIENSGYGVDVYEDDGEIYVVRPSDGDMF